MGEVVPVKGGDPLEVPDRATLCFPSYSTRLVLHGGERGYREQSNKWFAATENAAAEQLVQLKTRLRSAGPDDFWSLLMEGMTGIAGAQYAFVAKRILVDDEDSAVEMPPIGEPGSCLMGVAFYYDDGRGKKALERDYKYVAYGAPCAHMRHDKVFIIPERLHEIIPDNVNNFPFPPDAYIGVPLFSEGKCFAHFGMMWSAEALAARRLTWNYLEMFLHSLEDLILGRMLEGQGFAKGGLKTPQIRRNMVISKENVVSTSQSLRPYARSLSHELRTPMQGVVGMLDVMHATVQEAAEDYYDSLAGSVFQSLRANIEIVQDSSRRAVEAADNVVHAYDLNMEVPDTPMPPIEEGEQDSDSRLQLVQIHNQHVFKEADDYSFPSGGTKRPRSDSSDWNYGSARKYRVLETSESPMPSPRQRPVSSRQECVKQAVRESDRLMGVAPQNEEDERGSWSTTMNPSTPQPPPSLPDVEPAFTPGIRHTRIRELLHHIINETLRVGGRPDYAIANDTERGEIIEVRSRSSDGEIKSKVIEWTVDPAVPEIFLVDERDLAKLVSCVFLNALKFTEHGKITLSAALSPKSRFVVINITDTGPGIPQAFLPSLFKPFSQEDDSLTRQKDGLGLGLLVAKGLVRKIGGDLVCVRSDTSGPNQGTEFEIRMPVVPPDAGSMPGTPMARTPTPSISRFSLDGDAYLTERRESRTNGSPSSSGDPNVSSSRRVPKSITSRSPEPPPPKTTSQLGPRSPPRKNGLAKRNSETNKALGFDKRLAEKYPLCFLVAEDNKINRRLLVNMLSKLGYTNVEEAYDGAEAVRQMEVERERPIDVVLMDLWMPSMDGYEATQRILTMPKYVNEDGSRNITVLAVTADVTGEALERAAQVGMEGFMTKPYKLLDLERLILEYCTKVE
ncbi:MAG: hypothetical protein M1837_006780 [Sclerophora amabilis]|nr:MAG: hypothetical protein M1837_006780 [Sclerophora amabilis]